MRCKLRWIVAALRHHKFFSLEELNEAIRELLAKLNHRPFRKKDGTRVSETLNRLQVQDRHPRGPRIHTLQIIDFSRIVRVRDWGRP